MRKIKQSKLSLIFILAIFFSCSNSYEESLLPNVLELSKNKSFTGSIDKIYIYSITADSIDINSLSDYPLEHESQNCTIIKWINFEDIKVEKRRKLTKLIELENQASKNNYLTELLKQMKLRHNIMFSACFTKMIGTKGKTYDFYEYMCFINLKNKTLYFFDYIEDPF